MEKKTKKKMLVPIGTPLPTYFNGPGYKLADAVPLKEAQKAEEKVYERKNVQDAVTYEIPKQALVYAKPGKKSKIDLAIHKQVKQMQAHKPKNRKPAGRVRQHHAHGGVTRRK